MRKKDIRDPVKKFPKNCNFHFFFVGKMNEGGDIEGNDDDDEYRTGGQAKCVSYSKIHIESWRFLMGFHRSLIINILEKENHRYQPLLSASISFLMYRQTKKESTLNFDEGCGSKIRWTPFLLAHSGKDYSHIYYLLNAFWVVRQRFALWNVDHLAAKIISHSFLLPLTTKKVLVCWAWGLNFAMFPFQSLWHCGTTTDGHQHIDTMVDTADIHPS